MASISVARSRRSSQPGKPVKTEVYFHQHHINLALTSVVAGCQQLQVLNHVPPRLLVLYANMAEELRALINSAIVEEMRSVEVQDAKYFQDQRIKWESRPRPQATKKAALPEKKSRR